MNDFLATVDSCLPECAPNSLDSLLNQCMYFGQSFGRIGADFRSLVITSFVTTVENNFKASLTRANNQFESNIGNCMISILKSNPTSNSLLLKNELDTDTQVSVYLLVDDKYFPKRAFTLFVFFRTSTHPWHCYNINPWLNTVMLYYRHSMI